MNEVMEDLVGGEHESTRGLAGAGADEATADLAERIWWERTGGGLMTDGWTDGWLAGVDERRMAMEAEVVRRR
jgi:hypothetical protein